MHLRALWTGLRGARTGVLSEKPNAGLTVLARALARGLICCPTFGSSTANTMKRFYVYTPSDGNEDGKFSGLPLAKAKSLACRTAEKLRMAGEPDCRAYVLECDTGNFEWATGLKGEWDSVSK